jgi:sortase B
MGKRTLKLLLIIIFIYSLYILSIHFYDSYQNNKTYEEIREDFITQEEEEEVEVEEDKPIIMNKFHRLLEINNDVIGWIKIPGTKIDYPVVKTDNNDFYLEHDINQKKSKAGTIFMDFRNQGDGTDKHTILYGHHMRDGSMFTELMKFKQKEFIGENMTILFDTLYEEITFEIFSVYVTGTDFYYIETSFSSDGEYLDFLKIIQEKSMFERDLTLKAEDQILTLSTCTYEFDNARFVVHARRINE